MFIKLCKRRCFQERLNRKKKIFDEGKQNLPLRMVRATGVKRNSETVKRTCKQTSGLTVSFWNRLVRRTDWPHHSSTTGMFQISEHRNTKSQTSESCYKKHNSSLSYADRVYRRQMKLETKRDKRDVSFTTFTTAVNPSGCCYYFIYTFIDLLFIAFCF